LNNRYFTPMGEIAYRFQGTVDKHIGDSIMVYLLFLFYLITGQSHL
jgi:class 3 adenylate cyclase